MQHKENSCHLVVMECIAGCLILTAAAVRVHGIAGASTVGRRSVKKRKRKGAGWSYVSPLKEHTRTHMQVIGLFNLDS